jgi:hypothetical protein
LLNRDSGNNSRLAVVKDVKVLFLQVAQRVALLIADYDRYQDPAHIHFNPGGRVLRLIPPLSGGVCAGDEHQATESNNWAPARISIHNVLDPIATVLVPNTKCRRKRTAAAA